MIKPKFIQRDCRESEVVGIKGSIYKSDPRQANAVQRFKPDIIVFEHPNNNKTPEVSYNKFPAPKPEKIISEINKSKFSKELLRIHPWIVSDQMLWKNITNLWQVGHEIKLYEIDGPTKLTSQCLALWRNAYPNITKNYLWWSKIYLREVLMAKNMEWVLKNYTLKENPTILAAVQSFHWKHVMFLLTNPTKEEIWKYYFGQFDVTPQIIADEWKKENQIMYQYWNKISKDKKFGI